MTEPAADDSAADVEAVREEYTAEGAEAAKLEAVQDTVARDTSSAPPRQDG